MAYEFSKLTKQAITGFNEKYGISVDPEELGVALNSIKESLKIFNSETYKYSNNKESYKEQCSEIIMLKYNAAYKNMITSAMADYIEKSSQNEFNKDVNCGSFLEDFESMMNGVLVNENKTYKYAPLSKIAYGGMKSDELLQFIENQNIQTQKEYFMQSFQGKSVSSIKREVTESYINGSAQNYANYISMAQAIKAKNEARGFWGRFFHPIDSNREKNMVKALCNKAKERYPQKNVDKDLAEKSFLSDNGKKERDEMYNSVQKLKKIEFDPTKYETEKYTELSKKDKSSPEKAKEKAEALYRKNIAPTLEKMYKALENENSKEKEFDLGAFAKKLKLNLVDAAGYQKRFLEEKREKEDLMRKSKEYKQNELKFKKVFEKGGDFTALKEELGEDFDLMKSVYIKDRQKQEDAMRKSKEYKQNEPKFKEAYENGGDFTALKDELGENFGVMKSVYIKDRQKQEDAMRKSDMYKQNEPKFKEAYENGEDFTSLKEEIGEDFDLMKFVYMQDTQKQEKVTDTFTEMLKKDVDDNLKIDAEVKAEKVIAAKEIVPEK